METLMQNIQLDPRVNFDTIPACQCDRQTDTQTQTHDDSWYPR